MKEPQPIDDGSNYHVMALSGLKMRDLPNLKGKKILTIPYNGEVEVIATGFGELKVKELEDFYIEGEWVQVSYNGKEGYVFDGYLTQFPLPDKKKIGINQEKEISKFYYFFNTNFSIKSDRSNFITEEKENCKYTLWDKCRCGFSQRFNNQISYKINYCVSKTKMSTREIVEIENISLTEAYFITSIIEKSSFNEPKYHKNSNMINFYNYKETGARLEIKPKDNNKVVITLYAGC